MKQLNEMFSPNELTEYLNSRLIDEGVIGDWFKKTFNYLKGKVAMIGKFFVALFNGEPLSAMTPITAQTAFKNKDFDTRGVYMVGTKEDARYSHISTNPDYILDDYDSDTLKWWKDMSASIKEAQENGDYDRMINERMQLANDDRSIGSADGKELEYRIKKVLMLDGQRPLFIYGAPGVGKTEVVRSVFNKVKEEGARMISLKLSLKANDDFFLPSFLVDEKGNKVAAADIPKSYFPVYKMTGDKEKDAAADAACGKGLIFIDEFSQAKPSVQGTMLTFIQDRVLGEEYVVGSGWKFIAASNREADGVMGNDLNRALLDRFDVCNYEPKVKDWIKWAKTKSLMSPLFLNWIEENEKYFYYQDTEDDAKIASPRGWTEAFTKGLYGDWQLCCQHLSVYEHTAKEEGFDILDIPDDVIRRTLTFAVGRGAADAFMDYVKLARTINIEDLRIVLTKPDEAPLPETDKNGNYRTDILYIICTFLVSLLKTMPTSEEFTNICKYIGRLNKESACGKMIRSITKKFPKMNMEFGEIPGHDKYVEGLRILQEFYPEYDAAEDL